MFHYMEVFGKVVGQETIHSWEPLTDTDKSVSKYSSKDTVVLTNPSPVSEGQNPNTMGCEVAYCSLAEGKYIPVSGRFRLYHRDTLKLSGSDKFFICIRAKDSHCTMYHGKAEDFEVTYTHPTHL